MAISVPTHSEFAVALTKLSAVLPPAYLRLLQAHYYSPGRAITARDAAASVGYANFNAANLHYGRLAGLIAGALAIAPPTPDKVELLATFARQGNRKDSELLWVMRPALARALESLCWVRPDKPEQFLRLATWNCCRGSGTKVQYLRSLRPDVMAIQECAQPDDEPASRYAWAGPKKSHGLLLAANQQSTITAVPSDGLGSEVYVAAQVGGPIDFRVLAVWVKPLGKRWRTYERSLENALDYYGDWLSKGPAVVMGDFNADARLKNGSEAEWATRLSRDFGLVSAYHAFHHVLPRKETRQTFYQYRHANRAYDCHIDMCFVPEAWLRRIVNVNVGSYEQWSRLSDHCPLVVDIAL